MTASSAQRRAATRSPPARAAPALKDALQRRVLGHGTQLRPGLDRVPRRRSIAGGQGRDGQRRVALGRGNPTQLGGGLDGRVGGGPGRRRVTLVRQHDAVAREANRLKEPIVSCLGLGHQLAELCGGTDQITLIYLCISEAPAAQPRAVPVADRVGEVASFLGERTRRDRVTGVARCASPGRRGAG